MEVITFENVEKLNIFAAEKFVEIAKDSIAERGQFTVALSGGSTPKKLYALLTQEPFCSQIEWQKLQFFFGDERVVLPRDKESNFRMAKEALFSRVKIPAENIHRFQTEKTVNFIKSDYPGCGFGWRDNIEKLVRESSVKMEKTIRKIFRLRKNEFPRFDLILLGMGNDGHTASLFPETEGLKEDKRIAIENWVEKFSAFRLTFTFPTINNARNIIFLISGEDKAETLKEVLYGEFQPEKLPSQAVKPVNGNLLFLTDIKL